MGDDFYDHVARQNHLARLAAETSSVIDVAKELVLAQFGERGCEAHTLVVEVAKMISTREFGERIAIELSNGLSSIENSINGK